MEVFLAIFAVFVVLYLLEQFFPHKKLPYKKGWIIRVIFFNFLQLVITSAGYYLWEPWFIGMHSTFNLKERLTPIQGGVFAYLINTWIFYWWHRIRHENRIIWRVFHQFHHSPERIEVLTSFYKHPFEIIANAIIITILVYPILGLSVESNGWMSILSALGEFIYHLNIRTPYWIGFIIQRPESHCVHHLRDRLKCYNYADIPIWDILGGTFWNPTEEEFQKIKTGFSKEREELVVDMMLCKDVLNNNYRGVGIKHALSFLFLLFIGTSNTIGYTQNMQTLTGFGIASCASPRPFVFSVYNGVETFSTEYRIGIHYNNGTTLYCNLDNKIYGSLKGPYNRKNVYGAVLSHGPFFNTPELIRIRDEILTWGLCGPAPLAEEFGFGGSISSSLIEVGSKTKGENRTWSVMVEC